jgi:predicted branched-subunit amino acid permease
VKETAEGSFFDDPDLFREGVRVGLPVAVASGLVGVSFGIVAEPVMGGAAAIAMSALVFAGAAQFAATLVLAAGGSVAAAVIAGLMLNLRFLPMGVALAPWMKCGPLSRAAQSYALVDASWALASRGGGRFEPLVMLGATLPAYPAWVIGTVLGVLGASALGDPEALGLDALFPAFFLGLLWTEAKRPGGLPAALLGAAIALALVPFTPAGVPIVAASLAALLALREPRA